MWKSKLPQKLKVFMWLVFQDTLQRGVNLKKRRWKGDEKCYLCRVVETMDHIFFECHVARVIWFYFKEALGWDMVLWLFSGEVLDKWVPVGEDIII